jgi:hypothetical protein
MIDPALARSMGLGEPGFIALLRQAGFRQPPRPLAGGQAGPRADAVGLAPAGMRPWRAAKGPEAKGKGATAAPNLPKWCPVPLPRG